MKTSRSAVQSALRAVALTAAVALVAAAGTAVVSQTAADNGARLADATVSGSPSDSATPTADPTASPSQELQQFHISVPPWVGGQLRPGATIRAQFAVSFKPTYAYQWLRDGVEIAGATDKEYVPALADGGHRLSWRCLVTKDGYAPLTVTSSRFPIQLADVEAVKAPWLSGRATVGSTLTLHIGEYNPAPDNVHIWWFRGDKHIAGAHGSTYRLTKADAGKDVSAFLEAGHQLYAPAQERTRSVHVR